MNLLDFLETATVPVIQEALVAKRFSSYDLVRWYMERIATYDSGGSKVNSVLEMNPDALFIANALDAERALHGPRSPIHGIPILLKDNIDTGDKLHTSAGSLALANSYASKDAFLVSCLRKAGAIILGKANMTEWANFMSNGMKNGYSSRGGQVLNPYGLGHCDVGGSSSGSGAAVAANFVTVAIGTETSGSIVSPANANSVVGIKPTVGLISRSGVIPIAHSQDTPGPLTKNVTDAAILLNILAVVDQEDPATWNTDQLRAHDYTEYLAKDGLKGARIGVPRHYYERLDAERLNLVDAAIASLQAAGATVIDPISIPSEEEKNDINVLSYEFKAALDAYLGHLGPHVPVHSLRELISYNQQHAETMLRYGQTIMIKSEATSGKLTEPEYINARIRDLRQTRDQGIDAALAANDLDALLMPGPWGAGLAAKAGYPAICVPAGYLSNGCPTGITFVASAYEEPIILKLAYAFEQATRHRRPPYLKG